MDVLIRFRFPIIGQCSKGAHYFHRVVGLVVNVRQRISVDGSPLNSILYEVLMGQKYIDQKFYTATLAFVIIKIKLLARVHKLCITQFSLSLIDSSFVICQTLEILVWLNLFMKDKCK